MNSDAILNIAKQINEVLWGGPLLLIPLLGTGILFTLKLRCIQVSRLKTAIEQITAKPEVEKLMR